MSSLRNIVAKDCTILITEMLNFFLLQAIFITFWITFLVDETFVCDERIDCFPISIALLQDSPIENCTTFDSDDVEIRCYQFVLRYAETLGVAGGVLAIYCAITRGMFDCFVWLCLQTLKADSNRDDSHRDTCTCKKISWCVIMVACVGGIIVS